MPMTGVTRTSNGVGSIDTNHMQNVINNLRARITSGATINAQDAIDLAWLYNSWIQHTHGYYDHAFEKYGNLNPGYWSTTQQARYDGANYISTISGSSSTMWVWDGVYVGDWQPAGTTPPGFSFGAFMESVPGWEGDYTYKYQIVGDITTYVETANASVGGWETSSAITGLDWFDYADNFKVGNNVAAWVVQDLATLVNRIRSHTHTWYEDYLDYTAG